jgi:hypothetical protein
MRRGSTTVSKASRRTVTMMRRPAIIANRLIRMSCELGMVTDWKIKLVDGE